MSNGSSDLEASDDARIAGVSPFAKDSTSFLHKLARYDTLDREQIPAELTVESSKATSH